MSRSILAIAPLLLLACSTASNGGSGTEAADAAIGFPDGAGGAADANTGPAADAQPSGQMVEIPGGAFLMGSNSGDADEAPQHSVTLSSFEIDYTEVTQGAYKKCVDGGGCTEPSANYSPIIDEQMPVVNVTWDQALTYCVWVGKTLPTEAQWERAARGTDGRTFPWGADATVDCARANTSSCGGTQEVGLATGVSPEGALDMAGNVWEWTADFYAADAYAAHDGPDPLGPSSGTLRAYRGGSAGNDLSLARASNRASTYNPDVGGSGLGFRCAR